jgi:hypothetical protein
MNLGRDLGSYQSEDFTRLAVLYDTWGQMCGAPDCEEIRTVGYEIMVDMGDGPGVYMFTLCQQHLFEAIEKDQYGRNFSEQRSV